MTVAEILSRYDSKIEKQSLQVRDYLLAELKDIIEIPDDSPEQVKYIGLLRSKEKTLFMHLHSKNYCRKQ